MSLYLYNLGISLQSPYPSQGAFYSPSNSGLMQSNAWLQWNPALAPPSWLADNVFTVPNTLVSGNWSYVQGDGNPMNVNSGDYVVVRAFLSDTPAPTGCVARMAIVFGKGTSGDDAADLSPMQTPLQMTSNNNQLPRTLIDTDNAVPSQSPASDNSWTFCIGMMHGATNSYSFNVGVTLIQNSVQAYTFGRDPQLKVTGMGGLRREAA
jgi:hypothetical protein